MRYRWFVAVGATSLPVCGEDQQGEPCGTLIFRSAGDVPREGDCVINYTWLIVLFFMLRRICYT